MVHNITYLVTFACASFVAWKPSQNPCCSDGECTSFFSRHKFNHKTFLSGSLCMNLVWGAQGFWNGMEIFYVWKLFFCTCIFEWIVWGYIRVSETVQNDCGLRAHWGTAARRAIKLKSLWVALWLSTRYSSLFPGKSCHTLSYIFPLLCLAFGVRRLKIFSTTGLLQLLFSLWCPL